MKQYHRDSRGRFKKQYRQATVWDKLMVIGVALFAIGVVIYEEYTILVEPVWAYNTVEVVEPEPPKEVRIEVTYSVESVKRHIEDTFGEGHIMLKVAECESGFDQYAFNPTNNSNDRGVFQISELYHGVGDEMFDVKKNIAYAKKLYDKNGLRDWLASKPCWG